MVKIIVNADDFGLSKSTNRAIIEAFRKGLISSTTLMVNAEGFEDACELIKKYELNGKVGLHLNFSTGYPLTEDIKKLDLFCDENGKFIKQENPLFYIGEIERKAVYAEMAAQLNELTSRNIIPSHVDSHHHFHTKWAIGTEVIRFAKNNGIVAVRLARNSGSASSAIKRFYRQIYNQRLKRNGLSQTIYFGSVKDISMVHNLETNDRLEIMVHPKYDETGQLVDMYKDNDLYKAVHSIFKKFPQFKLVTF